VSLARALRLAAQVREAAARDPIAALRWLPLQERYLRSQARYRLIRAGNQSLGKTTALLADLLLAATGRHPYRLAGAEAAGEYALLCASWSQSVAIQAKLHDLVGAFAHPKTVFSPIRGFRGKSPAVEVRHERGGYSLIRIRTTQQSVLDLAGSSLLGAAFDEVPASEGHWSELLKRVQAFQGWLSIGMTPIGAPVDWVRDLVAAGLLEDLHSRLEPAACIPVGATHPRCLPDGRPMDAQWIAEVEAETPEHEREVRVHGGWEIRTYDRMFAAFRSTGTTSHVSPQSPPQGVRWLLGLDHGSRIGKQVAQLVAIDDRVPDSVHVWLVDEDVDAVGQSTPDEDAGRVLALLQRHGLRWGSLAEAWGDRAYSRGAERKTNQALFAAIARRLRVPQSALTPELRTVKRGTGHGSGSLSLGCRYLHHAMVQGRLHVHPRCRHTIEALDRWDGRDDDWKDKVDAVRYALDSYIFARGVGARPRLVVR